MSAPSRFSATKVALATTAVVTATTLTVGVAAPTAVHLKRPAAHAVIEVAPRTVNLDFQLSAMVGMYGVGPVFQALRLAGVGSPDALLNNAVGLLGNPQLSSAVKTLLDVLNKVSPLEAKVPGFGPAGVYDSVNNLQYSAGAFAGLDGLLDAIPGWDPLGLGLGALKENLKTVLNQRRAFILGEGLGGTDTALALRQMIKDVESDSALWGGDANGVTGVVAVLFRNPSRPGGGLMAMVTPISELFGLNLSNPDAGSYTNADANGGLATKILNISVTDIGWKYDLFSDAPSTLNPLAWANSIAGVIMPTYLIPDKDQAVPVVADLVKQLLPGLINAGLVTADPTGGQGIGLLTQGTALSGLDKLLNGALNAVIKPILGNNVTFPIEGTTTYVTYDSGNLPLLEPFHVLPRLLGYAGLADITTPTADSFENVLTQLVALGYQDVKATTDANGVMTFTRAMDMAGVQADIFKLPTNVNWTQNFEVPQTIFNALIDGFSDNLLSPEKQKLTLFGDSALGDAIYKNALVMSVAHAVRDGLTQLKSFANPLFNQVQTMLAPVADALDAATTQVNKVIDQGRAAVKGLNIDVSKPLFDANRAINGATTSLDNGVLGATQNAGTNSLAARSADALSAVPATSAEPKQLTAATPDLAANLLGAKDTVKEKVAVPIDSAAQTPAPAVAEPAAVVTPPAVEALAPQVKETLQDKVDKANQSLKKQVTDTIKNTGGVVTSTVTNTVESVTATDSDEAKPSVTSDSRATTEAKTKQDNDSGKHHEDGATGSTGKVKVSAPSDSGGKHRAPESSGGGLNGSTAGGGSAGGSDGSGSHSSGGGSGSSGGKHSKS